MDTVRKKYTIMTVTSMGVRITPLSRQPVHTSSLYQMQSTSAESNVLNVKCLPGETGEGSDEVCEQKSDFCFYSRRAAQERD